MLIFLGEMHLISCLNKTNKDKLSADLHPQNRDNSGCVIVFRSCKYAHCAPSTVLYMLKRKNHAPLSKNTAHECIKETVI